MIGQALSHYRITAALGAGGMGEVYRATDEKLGRDVAIKVLPPEVAGDTQRLARFQREAQAAGRLNHPNIVQVYDVGSENGIYYIVMQLLDGESVADEEIELELMRRRGAFAQADEAPTSHEGDAR